MIISEHGISQIESFEGLNLSAYEDAGGVPTIGYGHTAGVKMGQTITQAEAEAFLKEDIQNAEKEVNSLVHVDLTQNQYDALVSFQFNTGGLSAANCTLLKLLNEGDIQGAADQFLDWDHVNGQVVEGLLKRREAERALFLSGEEPTETIQAVKVTKGPVRRTYTVKKGDYLSKIALNVRASILSLEVLNSIKNVNDIKEGQVFELPFNVRVNSGDTLEKIAKVYGSSIELIAAMNKINPNHIETGWVLFV